MRCHAEKRCTIESLARELAEKGIRSSYQRLKILQHLRQVGGHPTAYQIYQSLIGVMPTLAKATVYNTLHTFLDAGLVRIVDTGDAEARYDAILTQHGHFQCDVCGRLTDFAIDLDRVAIEALGQHRIRSRSVMFRGTCPDCLTSSEITKE